MRSLGEDRIFSTLTFLLPKTLKQLRAILGVTGYRRIWILGYADLARPLYQILKEAQKDTQPFIEWDDKSETAFHRLKKAVMKAPALGLPIQDKSMKREDWLGCGDSAPGNHSPANRLFKQTVRSGSQGMARMTQSNGHSKPSSA
jgi:hypothetical protein